MHGCISLKAKFLLTLTFKTSLIKNVSQRTHDIYTTSHQRRCNIMMLHRRWCDVVLTLCARWVDTSALRTGRYQSQGRYFFSFCCYFFLFFIYFILFFFFFLSDCCCLFYFCVCCIQIKMNRILYIQQKHYSTCNSFFFFFFFFFFYTRFALYHL